jgi:hypothetical protein
MIAARQFAVAFMKVATVSYWRPREAPPQEQVALTGRLHDASACLQSVVIILTVWKWLSIAHAAPSFNILTSAIGNVSIVVGELFVISGTFCVALGTWLHSTNPTAAFERCLVACTSIH